MRRDESSRRRIWAATRRYLYVNRRSLMRKFDIFLWPVTELLIWGFLSLYIQDLVTGSGAKLVMLLVGALIGWDIHYRGQQAITISMIDEIWTRNLTNLLISPLRLWEWIAAACAYGVMKLSIIVVMLSLVAQALYAFDLRAIGWEFLPLAAGLLVFGWGVGLFTAGLVLRFGPAVEAMIWGVPALIQPFSCVFYPVEVLPGWAQGVARGLPTSYAFEGMRLALRQEAIPSAIWFAVAGLNVLYFAGGVAFFQQMFRWARRSGRLGRLAQD